MYGMVGTGGGGGGGGETRTSSTRSRRSLRDQQAKRSLRNYRQASTMSLYERGSLKAKAAEVEGTGGMGVSQAPVNYRVIREDSVKRDSVSSIGNEETCTKPIAPTLVSCSSTKESKDLNSSSTASKITSKLRLPLKLSSGEKRQPSTEEIETPEPSPTHDIYCCSNVSDNTDAKNKSVRGDISNCCGVRYYHKDVNCEAYSPPPSSSPNPNNSLPHYHHYEHNHHHLISICRRLLRIIKQAWTGVKFGSDIDMEEIEQERRYRPERLSNLCKATHFSKGQVQRLYRSFKEFCPTGVVTEDAFREMYSQIFPRGASSSQYATFVFSTLDTEQEGVVSFEALITLLSRMTHGTQTDRLRWVFSLYDLDDDGCITREEMAEVVKAVYDLLGKSTDEPIEDSVVSTRVDDLFKVLDTNQDGVITVEEFVDACSQDANILRNMDMVAESLRPQ